MLEDWNSLKSWYNPHSKRFWGLLLITAYSLMGFILIPWVMHKQVPVLSQEFLKRDTEVERIRFNPWTMRLQLDMLRVLDEQQAPLLTFDQLVVNLSISSVWQLAADFDEIKIETPVVYLQRYSIEDSNIGRLISAMEGNASDITDGATETGSNEHGALRLLIDRFSIINGMIDIRDAVPSPHFDLQITPINLSMEEFSTLPDQQGLQRVSLKAEDDIEIAWTGSLQFTPLASVGSLKMHGSPLPLIHRYFDQQLGFNLNHCCLDIAFDYDVSTGAHGDIEVQVDNFNLALLNLILTEKSDNQALFTLPELRVEGGMLRWPQQQLTLEAITIKQPALFVTRETDQSINLLNLWQPDPPLEPLAVEEPSANKESLADSEPPAAEKTLTNQAPSTPDSDITDWDVRIALSSIQDMVVAFSDHSIQTPGIIALNAIQLELLELSNQQNTLAQFKTSLNINHGGQLTMDGSLGLAPAINFDAAINADKLSLLALQPWASEFADITLVNGLFNMKGQLASNVEETLLFSGDLSIQDLAINEGVNNQPLLKWQALNFQQLNAGLDASNLDIAGVSLTQPFARLLIDNDGTTNFQQLATTNTQVNASETAKGSDSEVAPAEPNQAFRVRVGSTSLSNGAIDFEDKSLPLPFRVIIREFTGEVSAIDSDSNQLSNLDFAGRVGEYGLAKVKGDTRLTAPVLDTAVGVKFSNISMPDLSGYTAEFAGRKIETGKLNLDLNYQLDDNKVKGSNTILMNNFKLGEKVESENAISLPLDLAVALMTDVNGVIDLDFSVSGDLDDPNFSASGLVFKALGNIITKAVTAPFKLLGGLTGGKNDDLDNIKFPSGLTLLQPPEQEKLSQVSAALTKRPNLVLTVAGGYATDSDGPILQAAAVDKQLDEITGANKSNDAQAISTKRKLKAMRKLAKALLPELDLSAMQKTFVNIDPDTGKSSPDELAFSQSLRQQLNESQIISDAQLNALAAARQQTILDFIIASSELDASHFLAGDIGPSNISDDEAVSVSLDLGTE